MVGITYYYKSRKDLDLLGGAKVLQQWNTVLAAEVDELDVLDAIVKEDTWEQSITKGKKTKF